MIPKEANSIAQACKIADPLNADAAYILALCVCKRNLEQGMTSLKAVLTFDPDHEKARLMLKRFKKFKETETSGNKYILPHLFNDSKIKTCCRFHSFKFYSYIGNDLLKMEKYREASQQFTHALTVYGISTDVKGNLHWLRAFAYSKVNLNRDAINDCSTALLYAVNRAKVLKLRAKCYKNMRDFENCVADYERLYQLECTTEHLSLLGEAKMHLNRFQSNNHYDVLDIRADATQVDIKKAYKHLSLIHHPDKHADASNHEKRKQEEIFKKIQFAFQTLSNPIDRAEYDRKQHASTMYNNHYYYK